MKTKHSYYISLLFLVSMLTTSASAIEVMVNEELVRVADNAIFLIDTSSSMNEDFRDGNASKRELVEREFIRQDSLLLRDAVDTAINIKPTADTVYDWYVKGRHVPARYLAKFIARHGLALRSVRLTK